MRGYRIDSSAGPVELRKSAYEMTYGHLPNMADNELLKSYPNRPDIMKAIQNIREHVGNLNHKENEENRKAEEAQGGTLKVGDLVLARVLPYGAAKLGTKYRRNIYKIIQRTGRKLKITAQFENLETLLIHVKNVKRSSTTRT